MGEEVAAWLNSIGVTGVILERMTSPEVSFRNSVIPAQRGAAGVRR